MDAAKVSAVLSRDSRALISRNIPAVTLVMLWFAASLAPLLGHTLASAGRWGALLALAGAVITILVQIFRKDARLIQQAAAGSIRKGFVQ